MKASRIPKTSSLRSGDKPPILMRGSVDLLTGRRAAWRVGVEERRDGADFFTGLFALDLGRRIADLAMADFLWYLSENSKGFTFLYLKSYAFQI
jgi:hypothetical protein